MRRAGMVVMAWVTMLMSVGASMAAGPATDEGTPITAPGGIYRQIGPAELKTMLARKDFTFVNVHIPYEGEIARTDAHVPYDHIAQQISRLPAERTAKIVLYCRTGHMSRIAAEALVQLGYTNVWDLKGGFEAWKRAGLPLVSK